ncbi:MAG TPA: hypothetical protein VFW18_08245 [Gaiellales bacterium]|nr:hypothetical protein [Gaiellales bacterium]
MNRVLPVDLGEPVPTLVLGDVGVMVGTLWAPCVVCRRLTCVDENNVGDEEWQRLTGWPPWRHRWWPVDREEAAAMIAAEQVLCIRCIEEFREQARDDAAAGRDYRPSAGFERARRAADLGS